MSVSVLETQKSLVLVEKGSGDSEDVELIRAASAFRLVATMNPGGDFGKKEVSKEVKVCSFVGAFSVLYSNSPNCSSSLDNILDRFANICSPFCCDTWNLLALGTVHFS